MFSADSNRTAQEPRIQGFVWSNKHCKCLICAGRDADFSGHEHVQEAPSADRQAAAGAAGRAQPSICGLLEETGTHANPICGESRGQAQRGGHTHTEGKPQRPAREQRATT